MHGRRVVCRQGKDLRQDNLCPIQSRVEWHHIASRVCSSLIYSQFSSKPTLKPADLPATFQLCQAAPADVRSAARIDRKSVVEGKSVSVRVDSGGWRYIKKKKQKKNRK